MVRRQSLDRLNEPPDSDSGCSQLIPACRPMMLELRITNAFEESYNEHHNPALVGCSLSRHFARTPRICAVLGEHAAVLVARTWSSRGIDPNTFDHHHRRGLGNEVVTTG